MITNEVELKIISSALEPGIRDASRPRHHFRNIVADFYSREDLLNKKIVDLGPGHFDFGHFATQYGATVEGIDIDPAVLALGESRSIRVHQGNLSEVDFLKGLKRSYDGIFCRGSINCCWFIDDRSKHYAYLDALLDIAETTGPLWISPCNEAATPGDVRFEQCVNDQIAYFRSHGFNVVECRPFAGKRYGIWSDQPKLIFYKNLSHPAKQGLARAQFAGMEALDMVLDKSLATASGIRRRLRGRN